MLEAAANIGYVAVQYQLGVFFIRVVFQLYIYMILYRSLLKKSYNKV
jgi:hypothetical protein